MLNTGFVPDNRKAYEIAARNDLHSDYSQRVSELCDDARQYPIGSKTREDIMGAAIRLATWNDRTNR